MTTSGIKIQNLTKEFLIDKRNHLVLNNISLEIVDNEITVILGKSGSGKTTLLKLIAELDDDYQGEIIKDKNFKMSFVFQEPRLMPWLTIEENIAFVQKNKIDKDYLKHVIAIVGLTNFEKAFPKQLSGGMQQRVALARALAYQPNFILMDEPFAALDYFTRIQMQKELLKVHQENKSGIVFVTHNIEEALLLGDKIIILKNQRIQKEIIIDIKEEKDLLNTYFINLKRKIINELEDEKNEKNW